MNRIWEDEYVLAFDHPRPVETVNVVIIPKKHLSSIMDEGATDPGFWVSFVKAVQHAAKIKNVDEEGFRLKSGARAPGVTPHMHWHLLGPGVPEFDGEDLCRFQSSS